MGFPATFAARLSFAPNQYAQSHDQRRSVYKAQAADHSRNGYHGWTTPNARKTSQVPASRPGVLDAPNDQDQAAPLRQSTGQCRGTKSGIFHVNGAAARSASAITDVIFCVNFQPTNSVGYFQNAV